MVDNCGLKCTKCGAAKGQCDCWVKCPVKGCNWSFEKGGKCQNPVHKLLKTTNNV